MSSWRRSLNLRYFRALAFLKLDNLQFDLEHEKPDTDAFGTQCPAPEKAKKPSDLVKINHLKSVN